MTYVESKKLYPQGKLSTKQVEIRDIALNDFQAYIRLVAPYQVLGHCHMDLCGWITANIGSHKLLLWPRDHGKSRFAAFYAAWRITRDPSITIIYGSATAEKAQEMLRFIKTIISSNTHMRYFSNLIEKEEGKRALWNNDAMIVDHPARAENGVVDSTVMTCGLTKTIVGKHCDLLINDDIQVHNNNTTKGREDVKKWFSAAASVMSANAECLTVGTRYHPNDLYDLLIGMEIEPECDSNGNPLDEPTPMFKVHMANVEEDGEFLWPKSQDEKGNWYGFNWSVLNQKKALYDHNIVDFYAQYYNNPNDSSISPIGRDLFQYYDKQDLRFSGGMWSIGQTPLSVYAAIDPAFTAHDKSDYTAICIGGIDNKGNRYLMHIERFKTESPSFIYDKIIDLYTQYEFKELRIEAVAAQRALGVAMGEYLRSRGVRVPIDLFNPSQVEGGKDARILNGLEPHYKGQAIYHYKGGNVQLLEEELTSLNPKNDDMKDAWFMVNDMMKVPLVRARKKGFNNVVHYHSKFGGVTGVTHG